MVQVSRFLLVVCSVLKECTRVYKLAVWCSSLALSPTLTFIVCSVEVCTRVLSVVSVYKCVKALGIVQVSLTHSLFASLSLSIPPVPPFIVYTLDFRP